MQVAVTAQARKDMQALGVSDANENFMRRWLETHYQGPGSYPIDCGSGARYLADASNDKEKTTIYMDRVRSYAMSESD